MDTVSVKIEGQDRRRVIDLLLKEIEDRTERARGRGRGYYPSEEPRELRVETFSKPVQKAFADLQAVDAEMRKLRERSAVIKARLDDALGDAGVVDTVSMRGSGWQRYRIRETESMRRERVDGNAAVRRSRVERLEQLKEQVLVAAASGEPLDGFVRALVAVR